MRLLLIALLLPVILFAGESKRMEPPVAIVDSLPWFAVRTIAENPQPFTRAILAEKVQKFDRVVLMYFATWCIPCRAGVKAVVDNAIALKENKTKVVLVNIGEPDDKKTMAWIKKLGADKIPALKDSFGKMTEGFGFIKNGETMALPTTLILDSSLKPLFVVTEEGDDWPSVLWSK